MPAVRCWWPARQFQSEQRFGISLALNQSPNLILLLSALWVARGGHARGRRPAPDLDGRLRRHRRGAGGGCSSASATRSRSARSHFPWSEALAIAGLSAAGLLLIQLERLLLPHLLPLAISPPTVSSRRIVGSLFRVLQMGVGYSLLPRLRAAPGVLERRRLIAKESPAGPRDRGAGLGGDLDRDARRSSAGSSTGSTTCRAPWYWPRWSPESQDPEWLRPVHRLRPGRRPRALRGERAGMGRRRDRGRGRGRGGALGTARRHLRRRPRMAGAAPRPRSIDRRGTSACRPRPRR